MNIVQRNYSFDSGHRVLYNSDGCGNKGKCSNVHGHTYLLKVSFSYDEDTTGESIGYAIDFGEIKRVFFKFIEEYMDHGYLANAQDETLEFLIQKNYKHWVISLGNPSAENIAKELFYIGDKLLKNHGLSCYAIHLHETPNCAVECSALSNKEIEMFDNNPELQDKINAWNAATGIRIHDIRKN